MKERTTSLSHCGNSSKAIQPALLTHRHDKSFKLGSHSLCAVFKVFLSQNQKKGSVFALIFLSYWIYSILAKKNCDKNCLKIYIYVSSLMILL
ncbi:hypothetical protein GDO78_005725 [Eleutherodactylus coqui]|uniref:Uncharacterized protein n=1 Tax=Eleutherodactylus coqui TaxID=57060 RepID=A0A8J6FLD9_ELECQ|nr:hypothetical protein GDO78_005725 [Eleutherodactylus coqui]